ncbi:MAG: hypothetical protein J6Q73_06260 [Bacteroidaceae bacterium]|nr:hypothetical protein [Bacteroidaceae bacterium]
MYHAFTARYNTYYNGNQAYNQALKAQKTSHKDNYLEQLPLLIVSDKNTQKTGASNYDRAIEKSQKAIKNHSIKRRPKKPTGKKLSQKKKLFYSQKEFNPFLWKVWFLMANSQFQKGEFTEAASTFIYISRLYENDPTIVAQARIGLAKCYAEMEWLYEAENLLQRVQRDTVPEVLKKDFAVAKANLLLKQNRGEEAIPYIKTGLKRKGLTPLDKAREHYLLGQLYAKADNKEDAYKSFGKTISQSPPYEFEFNARIRQTEMATNENNKKILRKLKRMARSDKNTDYQAQIYYAIGNLHLSNKDTTEAINAYETGVATGATSGYGTGMLHLQLAKLYWEKGKFSKAHDNYSKASSMLTEENKDFEEVAFRSKALEGLVQYTDIVEKESELLYWATLTPEQLNPIIDGLIEEAKRQEELRKKEEKKLTRENESGSELDKAGTNAAMTIDNQSDKQLWYFYNPQLVSQGVRAFKDKWGDRELKDYWRFSNTISSLMSDEWTMDSTLTDSLAMDSTFAAIDSTAIAGITDGTGIEELSTDPTTREFYLQQIPDTDEKKAEAHKALSNALHEAGIRFKDDVSDKRLTFSYLERVVNEYPEFERLADTYYQLFLAGSRWGEPEKAAYYKALLIDNYPDSTITKRIQEPDFFETAAMRKHKEDSVYVKAYTHYTNGEYDDVISENIYSAGKYPQGSHRARFMFIDAMSKLYSDRQNEALEALEQLTSTYSADSISKLAAGISTGIKEGRLLHSGISTSIWDRKADGTIRYGEDSIPQFSAGRNEPYYFVLAFPNGSLDEKRLLFEMARYNFSRYMVRNFEMTFEVLAEITLLEIKEFLNFDEAFVYRKRLFGNAETAKLLEGINTFIISKSNLDLLLQYYTFDDYAEFYEKNLLAIPEVEIDGYTLDEPDFDEDEDNEDKNR